MACYKIRNILLSLLTVTLFIICKPSLLIAEDHGGGHDAPKDEHGSGSSGEHGGAGGGEHGSAAQKTEIPEWVEMQSRLMGMETRILQKRESIKKLIEEKEHLKAGSPAVKTVVDELIFENKELQKIINEYEKESTIFKYRYPERGAKGKRTYEPMDTKSLRDIEQELGLDGKLTRNLKKIRSQYKSSQQKETIEKHEEIGTKKEEENLAPSPNKSSGDAVIILKK